MLLPSTGLSQSDAVDHADVLSDGGQPCFASIIIFPHVPLSKPWASHLGPGNHATRASFTSWRQRNFDLLSNVDSVWPGYSVVAGYRLERQVVLERDSEEVLAGLYDMNLLAGNGFR